MYDRKESIMKERLNSSLREMYEEAKAAQQQPGCALLWNGPQPVWLAKPKWAFQTS